MPQNMVVCFLLWFGAFIKGVNAEVQTIAVKVGGEAFLNCYLMKSEDVVQVTWQKISPEMNLATNSKYFSPRVNPEFRHKVEFKDAGLQNSTIIIKNVKQQDEGCYNCLFNIQHQGAITCKTCLQIYELNEPVLHVSKSSSTAEFIVSCSATGRPAPTVTLSVQGQNFSHTSTVRVPNTNGTVTVNTTAVLSGLHRTSTRVRCSVRLAFGSETEVFTTIPGFDEERSPSDSDDSLSWISVPVVLVCAVAVAVITSLFKKHMKCLSHSDHEENEDEEVGMELKDTHETPSTRMPLSRAPLTTTPSTRTPLKEECEGTSTVSLRQRGSAEKNQPRANPEQKTSTVKD
ncbi:OX-2 membrane glycoprotein-like [Sphaeramia orbicularis]|uniref:OX-2 membrane glycoprotein-like n=1 Tax=Sphaeramia orbicularis TaxID=375764 RepID=UPI00117FA322|nr:OX-2 membrane glycoprotein-like isoform X2 [Sphaeramia orbicularis]XP_030013204.1 OX-2 membrane glycoprotein-like [Sphaeramia orbicularis]